MCYRITNPNIQKPADLQSAGTWEFLVKFRIKAKLSEKSIIFAASTKTKYHENSLH